jgi:hypothetical protein
MVKSSLIFFQKAFIFALICIGLMIEMGCDSSDSKAPSGTTGGGTGGGVTTPTPSPTPTPTPTAETCSTGSQLGYRMSPSVAYGPSDTFVNVTQNKPMDTFTPTNVLTNPTFSISPALPAGLSFDTSTGEIAGTPTSALKSGSVFTATATYTDWQGKPAAAACTFTYTVNSADVSGTSTAVGAMNVNRLAPIAVVLSDGKVLVMGGTNNGSYLQSAEVFDPATGNFTSTGLMHRYGAANAVLMADGTVLVSGGYQSAAGTVADLTLEIFDPTSKTFSLSGVSAAHPPTSSALLSTGNVLLIEGYSGCGSNGSTTAYDWEIYHPGPKTIGSAGISGGDTVTALNDGTVLVRGYQGCQSNPVTGAWASIYTALAYSYNPSNGALGAVGFSYVYPSTPQAPNPSKGVVRTNGTVVFTDTDNGGIYVQVYDPVAKTFGAADVQTPGVAVGPAIGEIGNTGKFIIVSSEAFPWSNPKYSFFTLYDLSSKTLTMPQAPMIYMHGPNAAAVKLQNGKFLVVGKDMSGPSNGEYYNP